MIGKIQRKAVGYKKIASRSLVLLIAAVVGITVAAPLVSAQTNPANPDGGFNMIVSPLPVSLEASPGTSISTDLKVKNAGVATERIKVTVMKFGAEGEDGTPQLLALEQGDEFAKWATFSENSFVAEPNVWKTINMKIDVPSTAAFGYYYAVVFSRDKAEENIQPNQANLLGAVASLVLLDVQAPGAKREVKITKYSTSKNIYEFLPADLTIQLQNTGNVHVAPRGNIFITKGGKNVGLLEVNLDKGYLLPESYRKFTSEWQDGTPVYKINTADGKVVLDKNGKQTSSLDWSKFNPSKIRFGKYTAKVVMVYNDGKGDVPVEATLSFWVIPWRIIGGTLLIGLLVLAGLWATFGKPLKARLKKNK